MADDILLNVGTGGATLATEDISGSQHQRVMTDDSFHDPQTSHGVAVAVAADGTADLDSPQVASSKTQRLFYVTFGGTVATKAQLKIVADGVEGSVVATMLAPAGEMARIQAPGRRFFEAIHSAAAGLDAFRLTVTNVDHNAADIYAWYCFDEE